METESQLPLQVGFKVQAGDIVLVVDRDSRVIWLNPEAGAVFGVDPAEVVGRPLADVCDSSGVIDLPAVLAGRDFAGGLECARRDGSRLSLYVYATAGTDSSGQIGGAVLVGRDVTGYAQAAAAVRSSEEKYRRLFDGSSDIVMVLDSDGRILDANLAAVHLTGFTREELKTHSLADLMEPGARRAAELALGQMRQRGSVMSVLTMQTRTGRAVTLEASASLIPVNGGQQALFIGRDITERQLAEQRVRESEYRYRRIFEASGDAVLVLSAGFVIRDVNERACELLGRTRNELIGSRFESLLAEGQDQWLAAARERLTRTGGLRADVLVKGADGSELTLDMAISLVETSNGPIVLCVGHDVSERRRSEALLREWEAALQSLRDNVPVGIFRTTPDGRFLSLNPAAVRIAGYASEEEMRGVNVADCYVDPSQRQRVVDELTKSGRLERLEVRLKRPDGSQYLALFSIRVVRGPDGKPQYFDGTIEDVTEQRLAEEKLRQSQARLDMIVRQLPAVLWTVDRNLVFTSSLGAGLAKLGIAPNQVVGWDLFRYFGTTDPDFPAIAAHRRALAGGSERYELQWNGEIFESYLEPLRDRSGEIVGVIGLAADVTEQRRADAALRESQEKYRLLFESTTDSVVIADIEGRVLDANPACLNIYGYSAEEVRQMKLTDVVAPEAREQAARAMARLARGEPVTGTLPMVRKDGRRLTVDLLAFVAETGGEKRIYSFTRDVTERKLAEDELRASAERYRAIFETTAAATMIIEADTTVVMVNQEFERLFGLKREEVLGKSWADYIAPEDRERLLSYHHLRRSSDPAAVPRSYEATLIDSTGRRRHCLLTVDMIAGTGRSVASLLDITDRKRLEEQVAESEHRYRSFFDTAPIGIYRTTPDGKILMANRALAQLLGFDSVAELKSRNLEKDGFGPGGERAAFRAAIERTGELRGWRSLWQRRDGSVVLVHENARVVRDRDGNVVCYEGFAEEVGGDERTAALLAASEQNYRTALDAMPEPATVVDADLRLVIVNQAMADWLKRLGRSGDIRGLPLREAMPFLRPEVEQEYRQVLETGAPLKTIETTFVDDRLFVTETTKTPIREAGRTVRVLTVVRDITDTQRLVNELAGERDRFESVFNSFDDGIIVLDLDGRVTFVNSAIARRSGRPAEWWQGRRLIDEVPAGLKERVEAALRAALGGAIADYEGSYQGAGGKTFYIHGIATPMRVGGRTVGLVLAHRDVTGEQELKQRLQESEERYRRLVALTPDIIAVHQDGRLVFANEAAARAIGYGSPDEVKGRPVIDFVHPDDRALAAGRIRAVVERGESCPPVIERFVRRDGSVLPVEVRNSPFLWEGRPAVLVVAREVESPPTPTAGSRRPRPSGRRRRPDKPR